ncbi:MAG: hypothetical protein GY816_08785 [Cytophagales bacterium]|nr:hypothetical protein [Cytophagales bacterium]
MDKKTQQALRKLEKRMKDIIQKDVTSSSAEQVPPGQKTGSKSNNSPNPNA